MTKYQRRMSREDKMVWAILTNILAFTMLVVGLTAVVVWVITPL